MKDKYPIVRVTWDDTTIYTGVVWRTAEECKDKKEYPISEMETVGYLISEDKNDLRLTSTVKDNNARPGFDESEECVGLIIIPAGYVKKIEIITKNGWRTRRKKK